MCVPVVLMASSSCTRRLSSLTAALRLRDRRRRSRLGELARNQEVAQVPGRDVDHVAALAEVVNFLQENCLGHALGPRPYLMAQAINGPRRTAGAPVRVRA